MDCVVTVTYVPDPIIHGTVGDIICNDPENDPDTTPVNNAPLTVATTLSIVLMVSVVPPSTTLIEGEPNMYLDCGSDDVKDDNKKEPFAGAPFGCNHAVFNELRTVIVPDVTLYSNSFATGSVGKLMTDGT